MPSPPFTFCLSRSASTPLAGGMGALVSVLCFMLALAWPGVSHGMDIALTGTLGQRALLVIDGQARTVAIGQRVDGVLLRELSGGQAVVEVAGQRRTLRLGEAPISLGGELLPGGSEIVLTATGGGHFVTPGRINNREVRFMVDTGATVVAISDEDARRIGLDFRNGQRVSLNTANGLVQGHVVTLNSIRIGDVEVFNVTGVVSPSPMPYVLLGNSFLTRFQMRRDNDRMVLTRRY